MRNPLSAMVQCADSISSSLGEMASLTSQEPLAASPILQAQLKDMINNSLDAIDTIQTCATHQKRIVDDILTLSKLDSKLLVISPITLQPAAFLQDAYKMFKDEANKAHVDLQVRCDASIADLNVDWALLDPSRVLQVLINLLTNAIKFTQDQPVRKVEVIMGASLAAEKLTDVDYVPQEALRTDFLADQAGEVFYLTFSVKDTGCGLSPEHKAKLFLRFSQATPKTHVQVCSSLSSLMWMVTNNTSTAVLASASSYPANSPRCKAAASVCRPSKMRAPHSPST
jgi:signal transduction histidine kinase